MWWFIVCISLWTASSIGAGLLLGLWLRNRNPEKQENNTSEQEQRVLKALMEILETVESLTNNVGTRNAEIEDARRQVRKLSVPGELEAVRGAVLTAITRTLQTNQKLSDDLEAAQERLEAQANEIDQSRKEARTDALSGVGNRKAFDEHLSRLVNAWRRDKRPFVLILADLDRFKWVNDTRGHQVGDQVIAQMGNLLKTCVRNGDIVTRYGGDEFAILLPRTTLDEGLAVASRIRSQIWRSSFRMGESDERGSLTLSVGVADCLDGDTPKDIIERADQALYRSKENGRNQVFCIPAKTRAPQRVELVASA